MFLKTEFFVIEEGCNLKRLQEKLPFTEEINVGGLAKGCIRNGVRKYLLP